MVMLIQHDEKPKQKIKSDTPVLGIVFEVLGSWIRLTGEIPVTNRTTHVGFRPVEQKLALSQLTDLWLLINKPSIKT